MRTAQLAAEAKARINRAAEIYLIIYKKMSFQDHKMKFSRISLTKIPPSCEHLRCVILLKTGKIG